MTPAAAVSETWRAAWIRRTPVAVFVAFAVSLSMLTANGLLANRNIKMLTESGGSVTHTLEVMEKISKVSNLVLMAESSMRGYVITGKESYLTPYQRGRDDAMRRIAELTELVSKRPEQTVRAGALRVLADTRFEAIDRVVARYREAGRDAATAEINTDEGQRLMDKMRDVYDQMLQSEARLLEEKRGSSASAFLSAEVTLLLSTLAVALALCTFYILVHRYLKQRDTALADLKALNRHLEARVRERTAELQDLSQHLFTVREDEKKNVARELHDALGSYLTAINMDVSRVRDKLAASHPEHAAKLERTIGLIGETIDTKRRIVAGLRPSLLDNLGLAAALEQYIEDWTQHTGIAVHFATEGDLEEAEDGCSIAIFRVFQEALNNVAKHSQAKSVTAFVKRVGENIELELADDGIGIADAARAKAGSHGLVGIRERVLALRGTVQILRGKNNGTVVRATMPRKKKSAAVVGV